jgi:hypothetical protein
MRVLARVWPLVLLALVVSGRGHQASAQMPDVTLGVRAGGAFSTLSGEASPFAGSLMRGRAPARIDRGHASMQGGVFAQFSLTDWAMLQPELVMAERGAVVETDRIGPGEAPQEVRETLELRYITVPVLAKVRGPSWGRFRPSMFLGPSVGMSVAPSSVSSIRPMDGEERTQSGEVSVRRTEVAAVAGLGLSYALSGERALLLDLRYTCGLTNVVPTGETVAPDASIYSRTLSLSLGYVFGD